MADFVTDGKIAVDLTATYASTSANSTAYWPATPGTRVNGNNNSVYMFARAGSTIAAYDAVIFTTLGDSASTTPTPNAVPLTIAGASATYGPNMIGIAQTAIASANYGWIALNGSRLKVNCLIACQPKLPLFATATAGSLDDTTVSAAEVAGIIINTSATSASAPLAFVNWPHIIGSNRA